ncbi:MAG TPA: chromosomal replication initiator protein DnaA [Solirubrobacteraceae bacterium]|nr:chromosomal replication initiator protein DnaA [Solirubrobacteraceae bacterium]
MELPAQLELTPAWHEVRAALRRAVGETTYDVWLAALEPQAWDGAVLVLQAPPATRRWVAERFGRVLERSAQAVLGETARVAFAGEPAEAARRGLKVAPAQREARPLGDSPLIPRYTFEQFIIGDGNRLAHAAALAVAEAPGDTYNPLFLHAPPGLGKTHLLHAIGHYITAFAPSRIVRYTTVEAFTNGFIAALNSKDLERFKHLYRDADVLLIDDVQFLASKAKTEEEFFHTFNAVYDSGRQLVLTCDRLPRQLVGLEQRLCERFEAGLVAQLSPPDRATRIAILRKRAALDQVNVVGSGVLELIAERVTDNIRSLEGALIRIVALHSLTGRALDMTLAREVLDDMHPAASDEAAITVGRIQATVAAHFAIAVDDLISASRTAHISWPRQLAIELSRELTQEPLQGIGRAFGGRNHATVLHACRRVRERVNKSREDQAELELLRGLLT